MSTYDYDTALEKADVGTVTSAVDVGVKATKAVINSTSRKSLSRMAKESIFEFPCIASSSIDTDEIGVISKATEQTYATMLLSVLSTQGSIDKSKYSNTIDFLKQFHTNGLIAGKDAASIFGASVDSAIITCEGASYGPDVLEALWDNTEDQVNTTSVNDIYKPYTRTKKLLKNRLDTIAATEASSTTSGKKGSKLADDLDEALKNQFNDKPDVRDALNTIHKSREAGKLTVSNNSNKSKMGGEEGLDNKAATRSDARGLSAKVANKIERSDKLSAMEPTLVTITLVNYNDSAQWTQTIQIGVKSMIRLVKSNVMVENMVEASRDRAIFKFIKWAKGEYKLHSILTDLVFGVGKYKSMAKGTATGNWLQALKKRRFVDSVTKFTGHRLLPNCTIIITRAECEMIKESCGIDLADSGQAKRIMDKYFLLGIGIYDTESKIYDVIYDSDKSFTSYPMRGLISLTKKEINQAFK